MPKLIAGPVRLHRLPDGVESQPYRCFTVTPLSPTIGAVLGDIDLRGPFDDSTRDELQRALLEWKVIFFRDQHLTGAEHRDFASMWGELEVHPFLPEGEVPEVVRFEKGVDEKGYENMWHSDVSWREVPSLGSVLRAIEVPRVRRRHPVVRHVRGLRRAARRPSVTASTDSTRCTTSPRRSAR